MERARHEVERQCAIYTRTSTEEGLAQEFNSLHAQAEACAAFIKSQASEGWVASRRIYEDGGYSGGSLNRPALGELLEDIKAGRVDVVVVYKVDRLTRSLADFAKIVEIMDGEEASFASVTQSFNTTTSMGRLTLNVLLSFAQFEREVTGERIRDKFAASKAKGIFMGGTPPLGYDVGERALVVNAEEAERVRLIFRRFLEIRSVSDLADDLRERAIMSKRYTSRKGNTRGGVPIHPGALAQILDNPIYCGVIRHKGVQHPGQHARIIDPDLWEAVKELRNKTLGKGRASLLRSGARLIGKVFDSLGNPMSPTITTKASVRYRYYMTREHGLDGPKGVVHRVPMTDLEEAVIAEIRPHLSASWKPDAADCAIEAVRRVQIFPTELLIDVAANALGPGGDTEVVTLKCAVSFERPRNSTALIRSGAHVPTKIDRSLTRAVVMARAWVKRLESGEPDSIKGLARAEGMCVLHTAKLLPLAFLAPDLVAQILEGRQPRTLTLTALISEPLPLDWTGQRARFAAFA
ncbi:MAG: recombinase family protein [Vitreimonas sp.]